MKQGDVFSLGCYVSDVDNVYGIAFRVLYDPEFLIEADGGSLEEGTIFEGFPTQATFGFVPDASVVTAGLVIDLPMSVEDAPDVTDEQLLLRLKDFLLVDAAASGTTTLTFEAYALNDPNLDPIDATWKFPEGIEIVAQGSVRLVIE